MNIVLPTEQEMKNLNLSDPDEVVKYILRFYDANHIKSEFALINRLDKFHPLIEAIKAQKEQGK